MITQYMRYITFDFISWFVKILISFLNYFISWFVKIG
ncbi:hypothetical protein Pint_28121 [Pistacia integerrima]|uniref:Uncharacterized protein n=1 Tax=Pistacia integerrima TaxID=434235 RepID=A0ACC0YRN3_9ROSI|nr:hypothetical protein Pint_28121 [Pistacia integerrima]